MSNKARWMAGLLRGFLIALPRSVKNAIAVTADMAGFGLCVLVALWLMSLGPYAVSRTLVVVAVALISVCLSWWQGMYRSVVRYMGFELFVAGGRTAVGSAVAGVVLMHFFVFSSTPYR